MQRSSSDEVLGEHSLGDRFAGLLAAAAVVLIVIALVTVSWQALKAARVNPVESLKAE